MYLRLTVFLTKVKRVFHVSILSLVCLGNGYASVSLSYRQASTYRPHRTYYVTVVIFVCLYVCTPLAIGTASLDSKLIQQLMAMGEEFMYAIVLDLHKVYDTLDRDRWLDILEGYSVGPLDCRILRAYWYRIGMMYCAGGY